MKTVISKNLIIFDFKKIVQAVKNCRDLLTKMQDMDKGSQKKIHFRSGIDTSLLAEKPEHSWTNILPQRYFNLIDRDIYFTRILENQKKGRVELQKMLDEARKIIFSKEELIYWFHKIKEDSVHEAENILIKHEASFFSEEKDIDFESIGFLIGTYEEAEKFLSIMTAIEPVEDERAHYSILDELEKIDEQFLETDEIPGYYNVQTHPKIKLRTHQIKDLRHDWAEMLKKHADSENTFEGFGNIAYLLDQYHTEFVWAIYQTKPRGNIKALLDFHYNSFSREKILFLNHIEFRILPRLVNITGTSHKLYERLFYEWLNEKREKLTIEEKDFLLKSVVSVCMTFLDNVFEYRKAKSENKYNILIRNFLKHAVSSRHWSVKDQSMGGTTDPLTESNTSGIAFRDIIIENEHSDHISAMECLRIKSIPRDEITDTVIRDHLVKIFRNEPLGISPLFIVVYCESKSFEETWKKYQTYIEQIDFGKYQSLGIDKEFELDTPANLKIAKINHFRSSKNIEIYHLFINMNP